MHWYGRWEKGENSTFVGPGHPSVVGDWLVYHAWLYDHIAADQVTQLIINLIKDILKTAQLAPDSRTGMFSPKLAPHS